MADLCVECERLWREYKATLHAYLGLNRAAPSDGSRTEFQSTLAEIKERISQHENLAHRGAPPVE